VLPALISKFHAAKVNRDRQVIVWGTGKPLREFLHVDDLARGVVKCLDSYDGYVPINCGAGEEISISGIAEMIARIVGFEGSVVYDSTKPDGVARKLMDSNRLRAIGWKPEISLEDGLASTYKWALENKAVGFHRSESDFIGDDFGFQWEV